MISHHPQNGHPPLQGMSPTIQNLTDGSVLKTWNFAPIDLNHKRPSDKCQLPCMVSHHSKDSHPTFQGCSPNIQDRVTQLQKDGQTPSAGWSPTITRRINQNPQDAYHWNLAPKLNQGWSYNFKN